MKNLTYRLDLQFFADEPKTDPVEELGLGEMAKALKELKDRQDLLEKHNADLKRTNEELVKSILTRSSESATMKDEEKSSKVKTFEELVKEKLDEINKK